jgi:hypothetical protein
MANLIKSKVFALGKSVNELLAEVNKRGETVRQSDFSSYLSGRRQGDKADRIRELAGIIVSEWERAAKVKEK